MVVIGRGRSDHTREHCRRDFFFLAETQDKIINFASIVRVADCSWVDGCAPKVHGIYLTNLGGSHLPYIYTCNIHTYTHTNTHAHTHTHNIYGRIGRTPSSSTPKQPPRTPPPPPSPPTPSHAPAKRWRLIIKRELMSSTLLCCGLQTLQTLQTLSQQTLHAK